MKIKELSAKFRISISNYLFISKTILKFAPGQFIIISFISLTSIIILPLSLYLGKIIIDALINETTTWKLILGLIIANAAVSIFSQLSHSIKDIFNTLVGKKIEYQLNKMITEQSLRLDLKYFDTAEYYLKILNARRVLGGKWDFIIMGPIEMVNSIISLCIVLVIIATFKIWMIAVIFAGILPFIFIEIKERNVMLDYFEMHIPDERKMNYLTHILTEPHLLKEIKLYNLGSHFLKQYENHFRNIYIDLKKRRLNIFKFKSLYTFFENSALGLCTFIVGMSVILRKITIGDFTLYNSAIQSVVTYLTGIMDIIASNYEQIRLSDLLMEFTNFKPDIVFGKGKPVHWEIGKTPSITFKDVSFSYTGAAGQVLRKINFTIRPGEKIALVGLNGAGKTTIVKLITHLYNPTGGQILLDDVPMQTYKPEDIYTLFGVVFQDYARFAFSVQENIGFGNINEIDNKAKIEGAIKAANAETLIERLPGKLSTYITKDYNEEGITNLSDGEWQKIAIARAFFRNAPVIILDEPTASLDPLTEFHIYNEFFTLCSNRTTILISHRLYSIRMVDRILFLKNGIISEQGTHKELIKQGGDYAELFNIQASQYNELQ